MEFNAKTKLLLSESLDKDGDGDVDDEVEDNELVDGRADVRLPALQSRVKTVTLDLDFLVELTKLST